MECWHIREHNGNIRVMSKVTEDGGIFYTCEYYREKNKLTQIGVKFDGAARVVVEQFGTIKVPLLYDEHTQIWYHARSFWQDGGYTQQTDSIFGINAGGSFTLKAYSESGALLAAREVIITPANMSLEEYYEMQYEVQRLLEIFSVDYKANPSAEQARFSTIQLPFFPLESLRNIILHAAQILAAIATEPSYALKMVTQKIGRQHITKWSAKTILQSELTGADKVRVDVPEASHDIHEHQMLRRMLVQFEERIGRERKVEDNYVRRLQAELAELQRAIDVETSLKLRAPMEKQKAYLTSDLTELASRATNWTELMRQVETMLDYDFLQFGEMDVEETHLFRMHPLYSELYMSYCAFEALLPVYSPSLRLFMQSILKSPTLYEMWVLVKLIEHMQQWGVDAHQFYEEIIEMHATTGSIRGYIGRFNLPDKPFDLKVYYDCVHTETGLRPDFIISFIDGYEHEDLHILDAKYKAYSVMEDGESALRKDLIRSGRRYLEQFVDAPQFTYKTASIVHPDIASTWWNVKDRAINEAAKAHRYAHFAFTPRQQHALSIYLKRMLHENNGISWCCPQCASTQVSIEWGDKYTDRNQRQVRKWKVTYICEQCCVVWVANYCGTCVANGRNLISYYDEAEGRQLFRPSPLYKYATNNYNMQVAKQWNVHCPTCFATAKNPAIEHTSNLLTGEQVVIAEEVDEWELFFQQ